MKCHRSAGGGFGTGHGSAFDGTVPHIGTSSVRLCALRELGGFFSGGMPTVGRAQGKGRRVGFPPASRFRLVAAAPSRSRFGYIFGALVFIHSVETDLGLVMAVPMARLRINWAIMPMARETENSTV